MADRPNKIAAGHAALSICESLLICMCDLKVMSATDIRDLLEDAATTHHEAARDSEHADFHLNVAVLIERVIIGRSALRRS